ncbi:response regulator transcription factor [Luteipulveratus sp. YIM 133132]|uniref:response regulator transcription factor n=1 Tax=Luteipulveratus flavus TaxID=3031728 RepID=UPI0023B0E2A5|nr:response regulator transcription factor [Luteipulveratus sp. YIM 133132]MDE9365619.1 response regulator transcription factor [Luteipulveratus sp. YIM 133132]
MPPDAQPPLVVLVEDDPAIASMVMMQLEASGYRPHVERDGCAAVEAVRRLRPALVLLDIGLPGMDGIQVCRTLRAEDDWTPVVFLTAHDDEVDRVLGLELGADDYVTKPFSPREVMARIASVLRRTQGRPDAASPTITWGAIRLRPDQRQAFVEDAEIDLTAREFDLLAYLLASPGRVFTRDQLLDQVWGHGAPAGPRTVDVHVAQVRAKLGGDDVIRTVRGVGYAAAPPPRPDRLPSER